MSVNELNLDTNIYLHVFKSNYTKIIFPFITRILHHQFKE